MQSNVSEADIKKLLEQADSDGVQKCVVGAVIEREDKVLLLERKPDDFMGGLVELSSGTVDKGEDLLSALAREVKEETGLNVESVDEFVSAFDYVSGSGKNTRQFNFKVTASGDVHLDGEEHVGHVWIEPHGKGYSTLNISDAVRNVIIMSMTLEQAFWQIHDNLPRQAPGSDETTMHLFDLAGNPTGNGLEIGCGQGRASILLAKAGINLVAIDIHQPFLDELAETAKTEGVIDKINIKNMSMDALDFSDESFDIIWSEGSAYIIGWQQALTTWKKFLKPNGLFVATECCFLTDTPSVEVKKFWSEGYPSMLTVSQAAEVAVQSGYDVVASYTLPESDWWNEYYNTLKERHALLASSPSENMQTALAMSKKEIELYDQYSNEYGYVGFVLRRS